MIKKFFAIFLAILLVLNLFAIGIGLFEAVVFWFNLAILGGIYYLFFREK